MPVGCCAILYIVRCVMEAADKTHSLLLSNLDR